MKVSLLLAASLLAIGTSTPIQVLAQPTGQYGAKIQTDGSQIIRIDEGLASRCINGSSDYVSFHVVRVVSPKKANWWTADSSFGLVIDTTIEGASGDSTQKVTFPRAFVIKVADYAGNLIIVPVEQRLLSRFLLRNANNSYTTAQFDFRVVSMKGETPLSKSVRILSDITKQLPLPTNPFSEGFKFFAEYGNKVISQFFSDSDDKDAVNLRITFEFSLDGTCVENMETTGAKLVVRHAAGSEADGIVDIAKANDYCWRYFPEPAKEARFAKRENGKCPTDLAKYLPLKNPHILAVLNAVGKTAQVTSVSRLIKLPENVAFDSKALGEKIKISDFSAAISGWKAADPQVTVSNNAIYDAVGKYKNIMADLQQEGGSLIACVGSDQCYQNTQSDSWKKLGYQEPTAAATQFGPDGIWKYGDTKASPKLFTQQKLPQFEAVANDLALAVGRCTLFGIKPEDCL
jgi:hypothetical protein